MMRRRRPLFRLLLGLLVFLSSDLLVAATDPEAHYKLDETSGTTATDASGNGNHGTYVNGPTLGIAGVRDNAVELNVADTDDRIDLPNTVLDGAMDASVAFWIKTTNAGQAGVISGAKSLSINNEFLVFFVSSTSLSFYKANNVVSVAIPSVADNEWHHFVWTWDGNTNTAALYRNGLLVNSQVMGGSVGVPLDIASGGLLLGQEQDSVGGGFSPSQAAKGLLDDVQIYRRVLSAAEVAVVYSGLVGHWKFDEGTGATAVDSTAFGNDVTPSGATWTTDCAGNNGLEFDGLGDTAATNSNFDPPETGAIAFWLRSAGNPGARSRPFGLGGNWEIRQEPDGTLSFDLGGEGPDVGAGPDEFITTEGLSFENRWYHVAANFNAEDDSFEIYINGALVHSGVNGDDMVKQLANILTFGTRTGSTEYWAGALRDFRIYNRWLTALQIAELYGLVGHWKLDETGGTVAADATVFGNDGTYTSGPVLNQSGEIDRAVEFDGTNDFVDLPDMNYDYSEGIAVAFWVRPKATQTNFVPFFSLSNGEFSDDIWIGWDNDEGAEIFLSDTVGGTSFIALVDSTLLAINVWQHYAMVIDSAGDAKIYRNGILSASGNIGLPKSVARTQNMIADSVWSTYPTFDGLLDDVRLYNRPLCPDEVKQLYNGGVYPGVRIIQWVEVR